MKKIVVYCRVSTNKEEQKKSIIQQKDQWSKYINDSTEYEFANCGMLYRKDGTTEIISNGIYADEGISGTSLRNRNAFNQMILDAKQRKFNMIFVEDVSRFSRCVEDGISIVKDLQEIGVHIFFRKENINTAEANNDFNITLFFAMSEAESKRLSERLKWSIRALQKKGGWNSQAPFGYDISEGFLSINENEKIIVNDIFDKYVNEKYGLGKIARYLNERSIPTKKGRQWSQMQISKILDNKIYTGLQVTHTIETDDITRHTKKSIPKDKQIVHQFEKLRIISDEMFENVLAERNKRNNMFASGHRHSTTNLFSSLIYCNNCGGCYKRKKRHAYRRLDGTEKQLGYEWTCTINDMYGKSRCDCRGAIAEERLVELVKEEINSIRKANLKSSFDTYVEMKFENNQELDIAQLSERESELMVEMRLIRKDFNSKLISEDVYIKQIKDVNSELETIKQSVDRLLNREDNIKNAERKYKEFCQAIKDIDIDNLSNAKLKVIFKKILINTRIEDGEKYISIGFLRNFMDTSDDELMQFEDEEERSYLIWFKPVNY